MSFVSSISEYANLIYTIITLGSVSVAWIAQHFNLKSQKANAILQACLAAEKAIDGAAYTSDGQIDQAKLAFAVEVAHFLLPAADVAVIKQDITEYLQQLHATLNNLPPKVSALAVPPAPVKKTRVKKPPVT